MEPGKTFPEAPPYHLSPDGFDDIIAVEITEVSPDLVVLQLKEDTLELYAGEVDRDEGAGGEQGPEFEWDALQREDCSAEWRVPVATPAQGLTIGQMDEYCGMIGNSVAEEMYATYTIPEACFGNLELQFYPCDICEASFTDEQELERHVSDSHFLTGAKRKERRGKTPSPIRNEGPPLGQRPFRLGFSQPKMRKTDSTPLQCAVCGRIFKQLKSLQSHKLYHTRRQGPSNTASAEKKRPVTKGTVNQCPKCGRTFKKHKMLDKHRQLYHIESAALHRGLNHPDLLQNMSPLRCCECDRHFGTKETFYRHQCFHLRKQLRAFNASGRKGVNFFHCQLCALQFTEGLEFERHVKVAHPQQFKKAAKNKCSAGKSIRRRSGALKDRGKTVGLESAEGGLPPQSVDPEEKTTFTERQDCETVQLTHPCPECGKSFKMQVMLTRHQKMYHNKAQTRLNKGNKSYAHQKCTRYEKTFHTGRMVQKHKRMHPRKNNLKCSECKRYFAAAEAFDRHQCFHLRKQLRAFNASGRKGVKGVNFFHCQLCALQFTEGLEFERHVKVTHPQQFKKAAKNKCSAGKTTKTQESRVISNGKIFSTPSSVTKKCVKVTRVKSKVGDNCVTKEHVKVTRDKSEVGDNCVTKEHVKVTRDKSEVGDKCVTKEHVKVTRVKSEVGDNCVTKEHVKVTRVKSEVGANCVTKEHVKVTRDKSEVRDKCARIGNTSSSHSGAANTGEQGPGTPGPLHQCPKCGRTFKKRKILNKHQHMYHYDQSTVLKKGRHQPAMSLLRCCECDRHFITKETFYRHQCFHLRKQLRAFNASGRKGVKGVNFFHCQLCALQFTEGLEFEHHVKVTHSQQFKKAAKNKCSAGKTTKTQESRVVSNGKILSTPSSVRKKHVKVTRVKSEVGDNCVRKEHVKVTRVKSEVGDNCVTKEHVKVTRDKSEVGDKCARIGNTSSSHSGAANTGEQGPGTPDPLHQCPKCGRTFKKRKILNKHQHMYHYDQSTVLKKGRRQPAMSLLRCCECDRHFITKETFYRHQCFHLRKQLRAFNASGRKGVNFFHCQLCALQFTEGLEFEHHVKVTHLRQFKKAAKNKCSAGTTTKTQESRVISNGKILNTLSSVRKKHVKVTRVKSEVGDNCVRKEHVKVARVKSEVGDKCVTKEHVKVTRDKSEVGDKCARIGNTSSHSGAANTGEQGPGTPDPLHQCPKCGRTFKKCKTLNKHQRMYHRDQSKVLNKGRHQPAMSLLRCCECDRHFTTKETFKRHQCFHLRKQLRAFNASGRKGVKGVNFFHCQLCAMQFTGGLEFEHHVKVTHSQQFKKAAKNKCSAGKTTKTQESRVVSNGKILSTPSSVRKKHVKVTRVKSEVGDKCVTKEHVKVPRVKSEVGDKCVTKEHVKVTRVKSEVGDKCARIGNTSSSHSGAANTEEQGPGTPDPLHQCPKCGRNFKKCKTLNKHQRMYHRDQSTVLNKGRHQPAMSLLRCCECDRHFITKETFYRHQCFHLRKQLRAFNASGRKGVKGVNFFHCQLCAMQFTEGLEFERHVKVTHPQQFKKAAKNKCSAGGEHGKTIEPRHGDSYAQTIRDGCGAEAIAGGGAALDLLRSGGEKWNMTERQFLCSDCGKCFRRRYNLKRHQDTHTRVGKLHHCTECGRDFGRLEHLTRHQYVHTGDPSFTCQVCGQHFRDPGRLRSHEKLHPELATCGHSQEQFGKAGELHVHREESHPGQNKLISSEHDKTFQKRQGLRSSKH